MCLVPFNFPTKVAFPCCSKTNILLFSFYLRNTSSPFRTPDPTLHFIQSNTVVSLFGSFWLPYTPTESSDVRFFPDNHSRSDFGTTLLLVLSFNVNCLVTYLSKQFTSSSLFIKSVTHVYKHSGEKNTEEELPIRMKCI